MHTKPQRLAPFHNLVNAPIQNRQQVLAATPHSEPKAPLHAPKQCNTTAPHTPPDYNCPLKIASVALPIYCLFPSNVHPNRLSNSILILFFVTLIRSAVRRISRISANSASSLGISDIISMSLPE